MKKKREPRFAVIEGQAKFDPITSLSHNSTDYYDVFNDASGVVHFKPGGYFYRKAMQTDSRHELFARAILNELETLRAWVLEELEYQPPRWTTHQAEAEAKEGIHPDFTASTSNEANAS